MKSLLVRFLLGAILVGAPFCSQHLAAQGPFVYVNDNNLTPGANTATGFQFLGGSLSLVPTAPFATGNQGYGGYTAPLQEVAIRYSSAQSCLYVSDPLGGSTFPTGDVAAFKINPVNGTLGLVGNFNDPTNVAGGNKLLPLAIDRRVGFPYLFAAFTGENKIVFFKVNTADCKLFYVSSTPAASATGSPVVSMAVSKAGPHVLVVSYGDGYIQSFKIGGGTLTPLAVIQSTGFVNQGGRPQTVDITNNGLYAVFGDQQSGVAEVEVARILPPSGTLSPTADYGGPAVASGVGLGPGLDSENVWLSPGGVGGGNFYLYITNNVSNQVTTAKINGASGILSPFSSIICTAGFTNPTTLAPAFWSSAAGLHTITTTASGNFLAVAEFGSPSSVASLKIQSSSGCTREVTGSPFADPFSSSGASALRSLDVYPSRPY